MNNLDELIISFKGEMSLIAEEASSIMHLCYLNNDDFYKGIDFFIDEFKKYKSKNENLFKEDAVLEALSYLYIDFIVRYMVHVRSVDIKNGLIQLINIFEDNKDKGKLLRYMFLQSTEKMHQDISRIVVQLIQYEYKEVPKENNMPLIDEYFVSNMITKNLKLFDLDIIYNYIYAIGFYKTEESIKNTLALISFAATEKFNKLKIYFSGSDAEFIKKFDFYQSFKNSKEFFFDLKDNKIIVYYVYNLRVYTINEDNILYELVSKGKRADYVYNYMIKNIYLKDLSNSFQYYILKDYIKNNHQISESFYNKTVKDFTYIDEINSRNIDEKIIYDFILKQIKNNIDKEEIVFNILQSFHLKDEFIIEVFIDSNDKIKKLLYKNKPYLKNDFDFLSELS